ncbi:MAG: type 1 glutamine amidotransferase domain-containing protein [Gammaproteobacteria bacterium]
MQPRALLLLISWCVFGFAQAAQAHTVKEPKILFVLSAHEHGYWLPEVLTPYRILTEAGLDVDFASPAGHPGVQAGSDMMSDQEKRTLAGLTDVLAKPLKLRDVRPGDYVALYVPGGAGPMFDLFDHPEVNRITAVMYESGKPVAADCHGPAAFAAVRLSDGELMIKGKKLTAKSNAEEGEWARANYPFLLEDKLKQVSSQFSAAPPYEPWVVRDGNLLTGQNPASAGPLAFALLKVINADHPAPTTLNQR